MRDCEILDKLTMELIQADLFIFLDSTRILWAVVYLKIWETHIYDSNRHLLLVCNHSPFPFQHRAATVHTNQASELHSKPL